MVHDLAHDVVAVARFTRVAYLGTVESWGPTMPSLHIWSGIAGILGVVALIWEQWAALKEQEDQAKLLSGMIIKLGWASLARWSDAIAATEEKSKTEAELLDFQNRANASRFWHIARATFAVIALAASVGLSWFDHT